MKKLFAILFVLALVMSLATVTAFADAASSSAESGSLVVDQAGVLSADEIASLTEKCASIGEENNCDVVVVTTDDLDGKDRANYAMDFYDYGDYKTDGVLILLSLDTHDRGTWICTSGACIKNFSESEQDTVHDSVYDYLPEGEYYKALDGYVDGTGRYLKPYVPFYWIPLALAIGFGVGLLIMFALKKQLKTVEMQNLAQSYIKPGSMNLKASRDSYLYSTVTRTAKPKNNSSGGFTGSSGTSHGGSGRSF